SSQLFILLGAFDVRRSANNDDLSFAFTSLSVDEVDSLLAAVLPALLDGVKGKQFMPMPEKPVGENFEVPNRDPPLFHITKITRLQAMVVSRNDNGVVVQDRGMLFFVGWERNLVGNDFR